MCVPAVEGAALGGDAVVDLGGRVEGELDAASAEATEDVADDVELQEPVRDGRHGDEGRERVVPAGTSAAARRSSSLADLAAMAGGGSDELGGGRREGGREQPGESGSGSSGIYEGCLSGSFQERRRPRSTRSTEMQSAPDASRAKAQDY
ncbi:hypothetical protein ZWY2020_030715 [Hordeum vulgare]|nr:hypothetical protein ZWY2020_030715 [Hordeum vulgare]